MSAFLKPIIVPILEGPSVEASFDGRDYRAHRGDFVCPRDLGDAALNQTVTYRGRLVALKDGSTVPIFEDLTTFGKDLHFPSFTSILDHINRTTLVGLLPYPISLNIDRKALSGWAGCLPFAVPGVIMVEDENRSMQQLISLPTERGSSEVLRVDWIQDGAGAFLPFLVLKNEVQFLGKKTTMIPAGSISTIRSKGIGPGVSVTSYDDWFETTGWVTPHWPARCPVCNTPTEFQGFHLRCGKCTKGQL